MYNTSLIKCVSLPYVSMKYFWTPLLRTMISSAYFTAFFSPPRMNLDATLPRHFSRSQSKPADVKSWTTFFTNKFEKKQKNKPYKAFSLVGLNSLLYMFFLRPPAERYFPSLSWIPLLSFQHLPLLLQLSHGLLAVFQQIKLLKNNSSRKKSL